MTMEQPGADALLTEAIQRREAGELAASLTALRAYLTREHALLRLARLTDIAEEAHAAARLAQLLTPGDVLAERVARDVTHRYPDMGEAARPADWATRISEITGMTLGEARAVSWPFRGIHQPIGDALDQGKVSLKDLIWAAEEVKTERVREAARTILLARFLDVEPTQLPRPLKVITGSHYTEREERRALLLFGIFAGVFAVVFVVAMVASVLALTLGLPLWLSLSLWAVIGIMWLLDVLTTRTSRRAESFRAGRLGEEQVVESLRGVLDSRWTLLRNVTWPDRKGGDIDLVLVGPGGVWAFEVKAYSGAVRNIGDKWEYRGKRGWRRMSAHPGEQARRNAKRLQVFCKEQGLTITWVQPTVIWAVDDAVDEASRGSLTVERPETPVWHAAAISEQVGELWQRRQALDDETVQRLASLLSATTKAAQGKVG